MPPSLQDQQRPRRILAVVDQSDEQSALRTALFLSDAHQARLLICACVDMPGNLPGLASQLGQSVQTLREDLLQRVKTAIHEKVRQIQPGRSLEVKLLTGKPFVEICQLVVQEKCDLVIKQAAPLPGLMGHFFASVDQHLLRKCPCPIWLQQPEKGPLQRVIAAVDLALEEAAEPDTQRLLNRQVVQLACVIAQAHSASVSILHAWEAPGEHLIRAFSESADPSAAADDYAETVHRARQKAMLDLTGTLLSFGMTDVPLHNLLIRGPTEEVILRQTRELSCDLLVMGTVARTGLSGFLIGNTAENLSNCVQCSILAVKPDGFLSPLFWPGIEGT